MLSKQNQSSHKGHIGFVPHTWEGWNIEHYVIYTTHFAQVPFVAVYTAQNWRFKSVSLLNITQSVCIHFLNSFSYMF